jgi:hypothetical protein
MAKLQFEGFTLPSYPGASGIYTNWNDTAYRTIAYNAGRFYQEAFFTFLLELMYKLKAEGLNLNGSEEFETVFANLRSDVNGLYDEANTANTQLYSIDGNLEDLVDTLVGVFQSFAEHLILTK